MEQVVGETVDEQLVGRARAGDLDAWRALVARHVGLVVAICRGYGLRNSEADEVNQVVWLRLVEHLPRIRRADAISGWIAATTRAECLRPRRVHGRVSWAATRVTCDGTGLVTAFLRIGVRCQRLLRLVATEPRPTPEEISAALDVDADQVEMTCARCLDRLTRLLEVEGETVMPDLRRIVAGDNQVPDGWPRAAEAAFGWLSIDAPVAERVYDSRTPQDLGPTAVGLFSEVRHVRFAAGGDGVELAFNTRDGEVVLTGQLMPNKCAEVTARWPDGAVAAHSDSAGVFRFHGLPLAPLSVHVEGKSPLKTGWVVP